jgi:WS/DGAT/MGAT family acyltransferase
MSKVDTAWLRMDSNANLMVIMGVWLLKPGITHAALCERVSDRLLPFPRFTQMALEDAAGATWMQDPDFSLSHHVLCETLPVQPSPQRGRGRQKAPAAPAPAAISAKTALQRRVAQLAMQPLDRRRPLWQFHLIEDFDGGSALIARIHHCIADGIALISVMMGLVDGGPGLPAALAQRGASALAGDDGDGLGPSDGWADGWVRPLTQLAVKALDAAGDGMARSAQLMGNPRQGLQSTLQSTLGAVRMAGQVASDLAALALMPDDSPTLLKRPPAAQKAVAWCDPIALDEVKAVGQALGCSVNDVLLSAVAGAIGAYLRDQGDAHVTGKDIRAMVPVNLRPLSEAWQLGNRFGLVPLVLPIGMAHPIERVFAVRQRMQALKGSTQPLLAFGLLSVAGWLAKPAQEAMLNLFSRKTTAVMTNVPGPSTKLQFCGSTLEQTLFWVPQSGDIGVGVSILSYGGGVQFGLITDTAMCPDPEKIIAHFTPQFEQLLWLAMMLPWGDECPSARPKERTVACRPMS